MPPDEKRKQVDAWFEKAARDLLAADNDLQAADPFTASAVFTHNRRRRKQSSFLLLHDQPFRKTHEIRELAGR